MTRHCIRTLGLALLLLLSSSRVGQAASFDCNKATTETEIAICSDPELSALDDRLSGIYFRGRQVTENVSGSDLEIQKDQINWLNNRNQCGLETDCLVNAYQTRIKELSEFDFENLLRISQIEKQICKDQLARDSGSRNTLEMVDAGNEYNRCLERIIVSLVTATTVADSQSIRNDLDNLSNSYKSIIGNVFMGRKECFPCGTMYRIYPSAMYSDILEELLTIVGEAPYE